MTYQTKLARARAILEGINSTSESKIDIDSFEKKLRDLGAVNDETLAEASWEDLQQCGLPKLIARQIAKEFRDPDKDEKKVISGKKLNSMTFNDLFSVYNPDPVRGDRGVTAKLLEISKGKRCVVFKDDGTVDAEASTEMLEGLLRGLPEVATHRLGDDRVVPIYRVGEVPVAQEFKINPIYMNEVLRNEVCSQTLRSWAKIPHAIRQLVVVAIATTRELRANSIAEAHAIIDLAEDPEKLKQRAPRAVLKLVELERVGAAPTLRGTAMLKSNHPFGSS
jgi:hypothetical protein